MQQRRVVTQTTLFTQSAISLVVAADTTRVCQIGNFDRVLCCCDIGYSRRSRAQNLTVDCCVSATWALIEVVAVVTVTTQEEYVTYNINPAPLCCAISLRTVAVRTVHTRY